LREPVRANAGPGHDTATVEAFSGGIGGHRTVLPIDSPAVSLRLSAKRGIVTWLDCRPLGWRRDQLKTLP
jgi:hypothetical protein